MRHRVVKVALLALLLAAPAPVPAEITPEARPVVERYLEAVGGRAAFEAVRSVHTRARIAAMGLTGTLDSWTRWPDRRAATTVIGPFTIREGYDGAAGWRTDPSSGAPVPLDGKDHEDMVASAWYDNERWLAPDQGGGRVAVAGTERDSSGEWTVLEVTPPVGRPRRFHVNVATGLIDRATARRDHLELVSTFADYRMAGGRRFPHHQITRIVGMPANDLEVIMDSVRVNPELPDTLFALPGSAPSAVRWLREEGVARLPFDYSTRHVWLRASVDGGPPVDFLYDTGASITVVDSAFAARVGLATEGRLQGQGAGAAGMASFSRLGSLELRGPDGDGIEVRDAKVAVLSLNRHLAPFFWRDLAGVVGYDLIGRFVNEIDFDRRVLTLRDPAGYRYAGGGATVPFTLAGTVPVVPLTLDGSFTGTVRIDVGSSSTVDLHAPFVARHGLDQRVRGGIEVTSGGFGGTFSSRLVRMTTLTLGPYTWKRPLVSFSGATAGGFASEDHAGNLGNQVLERFKVTLDYQRRALHLEPGARFSEPDRFSRAGVQLARFGDEVRAMQVLPGSPAERAGLRRDDRVLALDGRPILSFGVDEVTALFERERGRVRVEVDRGGRRERLEIRLADIL